MRTQTLLLGLLTLTSLTSLAARPALQDGAGARQGQESGGSPFTRLREAESARIEQEIEGAWDLVDFSSLDGIFDNQSYRGFAIFKDGFLSLHMHGLVGGPSFLGLGPDDELLSEIYRYHVEAGQRLLLAGVMGFNNMNDAEALEAIGNDVAWEYAVHLDRGTLELRGYDGTRFTFRQVKGGEFPKRALEILRRTQGGRFEDPLGGEDR